MSQNKSKLQAPKERNALEQFISKLKIKYLDGKNPLGRAQTGHGFFPTKNASLKPTANMTKPKEKSPLEHLINEGKWGLKQLGINL